MWPRISGHQPIPSAQCVRCGSQALAVHVTPRHTLYPNPEEQKMDTPGTDIDPHPDIEVECTNTKAEKIRKKTSPIK